MRGPQARGAQCDCLRNLRHVRSQGVQVGEHLLRIASPRGSNEDLGHRDRADDQRVSLNERLLDPGRGPLMVRISRREESDDDSAIEDYRPHSSLSSSMDGPSAKRSVCAPARRVRRFWALTRRTTPGASTSAQRTSPISRPASRIASTGRVIWCFELILVEPFRRPERTGFPSFTGAAISKGYNPGIGQPGGVLTQGAGMRPSTSSRPSSFMRTTTPSPELGAMPARSMMLA